MLYFKEKGAGFIKQRGISLDEVRRSFDEVKIDLLKLVPKREDLDLDAENFLIKGKAKDGRIEFVLLDQAIDELNY